MAASSWLTAAVSLVIVATVVGQPLSPPADPGQCSLWEIRCTSNSTFAPSWCHFQNPLIVPRPPTQLENTSISLANYEPRYLCSPMSGSNMEECRLISQFTPAEFPVPSMNTTAKFVVVGIRNNNSTTVTSSLHIFDMDFDDHVPIHDFPGLISVMSIVTDRVMPSSKFIAFGGDAGAAFMPAPCNGMNQVCTLVSLVYMNVDKSGGKPMGENVTIPCGGVFEKYASTSFGDWMYTPQHNTPVYTSAQLLSHPQQSVVRFYLPSTPSDHSPPASRLAQWNLTTAGQPSQPPVVVETTYHYTHCHVPGPLLNYSFANQAFFNRDNCNENAVVLVASPENVAIYRYMGMSEAMDTTTQTDSVFYDAPAGWQVTGAYLFGQQIPPSMEYNTSLSPSQLHPINQQLWIVVTIVKGSGATAESTVLWVDLPEFLVVEPPVKPSQTNPSGRAQHTCSTNYYWDATTGGCVSRVHEVETRAGVEMSNVQVRWRAIPSGDEEQLKKSQCAPFDLACIKRYAQKTQPGANAGFRPFQAFSGQKVQSAEGVVSEYYKGQYGLRFAVFIATGSRSLLVYHALPVSQKCRAQANGMSMVMMFANSLTLMGHVDRYRLSDNGQYMFAAVTRNHWAVASMERLVRVCAFLKANPDNPFAKQWASACSSNPGPRLPTVADFMQIGSSCLPGTYCPSFTTEVVTPVPQGSFTEFFFDLQICPPGSMCIGGRKQDCPIGFVCPSEGTIIPERCSVDPTLGTTCFDGGLTEPSICPNGTLCGAPYLPPLPSPPGFKQAFEPGTMQRILEMCKPGDYCNLGSSTSLPISQQRCPANFVCPDPTIMIPVLCNMGGMCNKTSCAHEAPYCPEGTFIEKKCPAGHYCEGPANLGNCSAGSYCPPGSPIWEICPPRSYCSDNGATRTQCPDGYYCPQGVTQPQECGPLLSCSCANGCESPDDFVMIPVLVLGPFILYAIWLCIKCRIDSSRAKRDRRLASYRHAAKSQSGVEMRDAAGGLPLNDPLLADGREAGDVSSMTRKDFTIDFEFQDLGLVLKPKPHKVVMQGVTGTIRHGRVTAVMGPSGAGKSTFLTVLAGKAYYGNQKGTIRINGKNATLSEYSKLVGFVPQEDIMCRTMTVEENLRYCANTRLPRSWSDVKKLRYVDAVLGLLGLREIKHSIIGDERVRGISGGQRKRVNIGMEMCADPTVLFLDEPTSGLDSTSSMEVCDALRRIAELGLCIVTVIHQPRYEIFTAFHDVLLLGKGGRTVYLGPSEEALPYFEHHGFTCPPRMNPADFFMDIIAGDFPEGFAETHPDFRPEDLFQLWEDHQASHGVGEVTLDRPTPRAERVAVTRKGASTLQIIWFSFKRALWQHARAKVAIFIDMLLVFIAAASLAVVYYGTDLYQPPEPREVFSGCSEKVGKECQLCLSVITDQILNRGSMTCIAVSLVAVASMIRVFGSERVEYWREASGLPQPWHSIGYFFGKDLAMMPHMFVAPLVYNIIYLTVTTPRGSFATYYWVLLGVYYTATSFAYIVSIATPQALSQLVGVVAVFGCAMFAGGMPTLKVLYTKFIPLCWMPYISYTRYALEALYVGEVIHYQEIVSLQGINLAQHLKTTFGYDLYAYSRDVAALFAIGFVLRLVALGLMIILDRKKKL